MAWERLTEICGQFLGKGQMVSLEDDCRRDAGRTIARSSTTAPRLASKVEMLSIRREKDYAAETAAQVLETQAEVMGHDQAPTEDYAEAVAA